MGIADEIAKIVHEKYAKLPKQGKPVKGKEWTVIAAVVKKDACERLEVVSLGTGTKCIGQDKMSDKGDIIHDSHAEVLARRGFLRYLYHHIDLAIENASGIMTFNLKDSAFDMRNEVEFYFYSSQPPCGDASVFTMEDDLLKDQFGDPCHQDDEFGHVTKKRKIDSQPTDMHRTGAKCVPDGPQDRHEPGIGYHETGVLRTKPGRGCRTLSMSCSDKMARWNLLGLQGSLLLHFLRKPIYIKGLIVGSSFFNAEALQRAVLRDQVVLPSPFTAVKPDLLQSFVTFQYEYKENLQPSPACLVWCAIPESPLEVAVNGKKQGTCKKNADKPTARCSVCRWNIFLKFKTVLKKLKASNIIPPNLRGNDLSTYRSYKQAVKSYNYTWQSLLNDTFKTWTTKNRTLQEFNAGDE